MARKSISILDDDYIGWIKELSSLGLWSVGRCMDTDSKQLILASCNHLPFTHIGCDRHSSGSPIICNSSIDI